MSTFGDRLREERERLGYSQTDLGKVVGVTKKTQGLYERNERYPDAAYLIALGVAGGNVDYVLCGKRSFPADLSAEESALLENYRSSDEPGKKALQAASAAYAQSRSTALKTG